MKQISVVVSILFFVVVCLLMMENCNTNDNKFTSIINSKNTFTGEKSCKNCHTSAYQDWLTSDHYKAMQVPDDSSVLGNFNNTVFDADGVHSTFLKHGNKFIINTQGDDGKNHDYEVKYTFGHYPLQQYLIEFPGGKLQATRLSWDSKENKWFNQYAGKKINYNDWLHWTGNAQNWNTMCAECHSTNLKKNYNIESDSYNTTFSIMNVSCEACHGACQKHIDYINSNDYKDGNRFKGSFIELKKNSEQTEQMNTCAPCHSVKSNLSDEVKKTDELLDNFIPVIPDTQRFYADGQVNDEDYTYASFLQSKMFHNNVKCSNCHNPHSGKLLYSGNQLCLQCHAKAFDNPTHYFHTANTAGAQCINCHMPGKYFMGNDFRHDHSFRVPRPDLSVKYQTPNACNNCHSDKNFKWASNVVNKWYGTQRKYYFAEDLIPGSKMDMNSEKNLIKILKDSSSPTIIKATATSYLKDIQTPNSLQYLLKALCDKYPQIRYEALRSLANFPVTQWQSDVTPLVSDKVKAVRIAAADLMITIPEEQIDPDYIDAFILAKNELTVYIKNQADFAHGNITVAEHYYKLKDYVNAEKFYKRALKKDAFANMVRFNLATLYSSQGRNNEALATLDEIAKIDPSNAEIYFQKGLLYHQINNESEAVKNFQKATELKSNNTRLFYNYGLLLQKEGKIDEAEKILKHGLLLNAKDPDLNYAVIFIYVNSKQQKKAVPYVKFLYSIDPSNAGYQQLFHMFGLI